MSERVSERVSERACVCVCMCAFQVLVSHHTPVVLGLERGGRIHVPNLGKLTFFFSFVTTFDVVDDLVGGAFLANDSCRGALRKLCCFVFFLCFLCFLCFVVCVL